MTQLLADGSEDPPVDAIGSDDPVNGSGDRPARGARRTHHRPGRLVSHRRSRGIGRWLFIVAVALVGAWLGVLVGGRASVPLGPVETTMSLHPSLHGNTVVKVAPLGTVEFDSHDGPLGIEVTIDAINAADARGIFADPTLLTGVENQIADDLRHGLLVLVLRAAGSALVGGLALGFLALHPRKRGFVAAGVAAATVAATVGVAAVTVDKRALLEPSYTGLLTGAPGFLGDAQTIATNVEDYRNALGALVSNVAKLYDVTSTLTSYTPNDDVIAVLHISDLHVNPTAWPIIRAVVQQFGVDVVVDTGDIVYQGSVFESPYVSDISTLGLPYVYVRGNHDSALTEAAVAREPNAVVLDGTVAEVAGLRFLGIGDPRFTPDKELSDEQDDAEIARAREVIARLGYSTQYVGAEASGTDRGIDIALMHNPVGARVLDGLAPYILTGHMHVRAREVLPAGSWLFQQGSTGASGPNALRNEEPTPVTMSVLYFDPGTKELEAWDDITLGGLGLASAEIERRLASSFVESADSGAVPVQATPDTSGPATPDESSTQPVPSLFATNDPDRDRDAVPTGPISAEP